MPELPEVETTRLGISPHILEREIRELVVRQPRLRWPIPGDLADLLHGQRILAVGRRAKYLLLRTVSGTLLIHLGMSGSLRVCAPDEAPRKHDHIDIVTADGRCVRFNDPRRFGVFSWWERPAAAHPLLRDLGPEPVDDVAGQGPPAQIGEGLAPADPRRDVDDLAGHLHHLGLDLPSLGATRSGCRNDGR